MWWGRCCGCAVDGRPLKRPKGCRIELASLIRILSFGLFLPLCGDRLFLHRKSNVLSDRISLGWPPFFKIDPPDSDVIRFGVLGSLPVAVIKTHVVNSILLPYARVPRHILMAIVPQLSFRGLKCTIRNGVDGLGFRLELSGLIAETMGLAIDFDEGGVG